MDGNVPSIFPDLYLYVRRSANTGNGMCASVDDISAIERLTPAYWGAMIVIPACVVLTASNAVGAEKFQRLTGSQIRAKFAGMEVTDEVRWRDIYERDGTLRSDSISRKRLGKWLIHQDELCRDFGSRRDAACYEVRLSGNNVPRRPTGLGLPLEGVLHRPDRH